jgi:hypothetical protein
MSTMAMIARVIELLAKVAREVVIPTGNTRRRLEAGVG